MSKRSAVISALVVTIIVLLLSCNTCGNRTREKEIPNQYTLLEVESNIATTRAAETAWEAGDQIGIYAIKSGQPLSTESIYQRASNLPYTTQEGSGIFLPSKGKGILLSPDERIDLISYYPYRPIGADHKLRVNISDQSDLSKIDLLYSDNTRGINSLHPKANLHFKHMMGLLQIAVMTEESNLDLTQLQVSIEGVASEGVFDLTTGQFSNIGTPTTIVLHPAESIAKGAIQLAILLPTQELKGLTYRFKIGAITHTYVEKSPKAMQNSVRERRNFKLSTSGVELINATIEIAGKGKEPTPTPPVPTPPAPTPGDFVNKAYYKEQVLIHKGYMEDLIELQHNAPDSYFAGGTTPGGERRNYTVYFSKENYQPYMIAYPLYNDCVGSIRRNANWQYDPDLPKKYQMNLTKSYVSGYSRGHMLRSGNRNATVELMHTTYYFGNFVPQDQGQNAGIWLQLEDVEFNWAKGANKADTMYVVCGPILSTDNGTVTDRDGMKRCPIPTHTWKVLLKKKKDHWVSIGSRMPNTPNEKRPPKDKWYNYLCTVAELEKELGVKFFPQLPEAEAEAVKSKKNLSDW